MRKVVCDQCNEKFKILPREKKLGNGIKETYFNCPKCDKKYVAFKTDGSIRRKQRQIKRLVEIRRGSKTVDQFHKYTAKIEKVQAEVKVDMDKLMGR
ncbi:conserved hypothetical protein [Bacillus sp. 349Y]|nr:conserved hypothetical protein [Bacillus sp. 349Y]